MVSVSSMSPVRLGPVTTVQLLASAIRAALASKNPTMLKHRSCGRTSATWTGGSSETVRAAPGAVRSTSDPVSAIAASQPVTPISAPAC